MAKRKKRFKISTCRNPDCKVKKFMVEMDKSERYCGGDCRFEHKATMEAEKEAMKGK